MPAVTIAKEVVKLLSKDLGASKLSKARSTVKKLSRDVKELGGLTEIFSAIGESYSEKSLSRRIREGESVLESMEGMPAFDAFMNRMRQELTGQYTKDGFEAALIRKFGTGENVLDYYEEYVSRVGEQALIEAYGYEDKKLKYADRTELQNKIIRLEEGRITQRGYNISIGRRKAASIVAGIAKRL